MYEWGPELKKLELMEAETGFTPHALQIKPILDGLAAEVANAYNMLAARRTSGMVPNPIALSEISAWIHIFGQPTVPLTLFIELIGVIDQKFLELCSGNRS
jgi:hypothetical protein